MASVRMSIDQQQPKEQAPGPSRLSERVVGIMSVRACKTEAERVRVWLGRLGVILALLTAFCLFFVSDIGQNLVARVFNWHFEPKIFNWHFEPKKWQRRVTGIFLLLWTVLPPIWFWIDYFVLWKHETLPGEKHPREAHEAATLRFEQFKHGQELSRNIWLAIVALLAAYLKIEIDGP